MNVYQIDPATDARWGRLVERHPSSSIFHTRGWLEALRLTYGYEPVAYTTTSPGETLTNGLPFCRIKTWLTGKRLVSLPFSDHCSPLVDSREELDAVLSSVQCDAEKEGWSHVEVRPLSRDGFAAAGFTQTDQFHLHILDLRQGAEHVFQHFHKDSVQRKIKRAEREGVVCEQGCSEALLDRFYHLLLRTRRRHGLPPQPRQWFRNLVARLGSCVQVRVAASKSGEPIASIFTLRHKKSLTFKYGCSDERFNSLGGTQLLFWQAIQDACAENLEEFDLGRTDAGHEGLVTFKDRWGATESPLAYYRTGAATSSHQAARMRTASVARHFLAYVPDPCLAVAGRFFYRHIG